MTEIEFVEYEVTIERIRSALADRGMLVYDAFRAFNSSDTGNLSCSELYGGLDFLEVPFAPSEIYTLVEKISLHNDGLVSYADFKRVFSASEDELESRNMGEEGSFFEQIQPHVIPELYEEGREGAEAEKVELTKEIMANFKVCHI